MDEVFTLPKDPTPGYCGARAVELLSDWIAEARGAAGRCRCGVDSTMEALRLLDLIYRASDSGTRVACRPESAGNPT
jgi:hypothetical protein